jgi:DNA-binding response OmpR family regulator
LSRILIVEDEEHLAEGLAFNLTNVGYDVAVARTAPDAREKLARGGIDLVILDVMLPGGDGREVARDMRRNRDFTPILMLTAKGLAEDVVNGLDAGADEYMPKPFDLDELLARVRGLLRRQAWTRSAGGDKGRASHILEFGKCRVNFQTFKGVGAGGREVFLTQKEAMLLRVLAEKPGEVFSRARLLEEVWDAPATLQTRTVDNFIVRLRRYFEEDPAHPRHIQSVRGTGYKFLP